MSKWLYNDGLISIGQRLEHGCGTVIEIRDAFNSFIAKVRMDDIFTFISKLKNKELIERLRESNDVHTELLYPQIVHGNFIKLSRIDKIVMALEKSLKINKEDIKRDKLTDKNIGYLLYLYNEVVGKRKEENHETSSSKKR